MELRHGSLQSSQKSRLTALPALPRACPRHHIGGQAAEARAALTSVPAGTTARRTATGTTRESRCGAATAATGLHGVSRVLSFLGEAAGGSLPVLPGLVLLLCGGELSGSVGNGSRVEPRPATGKPRGTTNSAHLQL